MKRIPALLLFTPALLAAQQPAPGFKIEETTIAAVHAAFKARTLTCHKLVAAYLARIAKYDKQGPAINALVTINPDALAVADSLDKRYKAEGPVGPLHCIPMVVKDNYETKDLQTTAGSLALKGWIPLQDATFVTRIRAAGAIVLAKSNMAEWAFSPYETVSAILPGYSKNPYALDRVTAGSSGGTAAAMAANEGEVGLGTDTGNSIRGPSSHNDLVGIRSTMGLTSRAGVVPLANSSDIAGPMARTVADAVEVFNVVAGEDPADPVTAASRGHREDDYRKFVVPGGLKGARIGVLHQAYEHADRDGRPTQDSEVVAVFDNAVKDLQRAGATIIDPAAVDPAAMRGGGNCPVFKYDLQRYFAARGQNAPVKSIDDILRSRAYHPSVQLKLQTENADTIPPEDNPGCKAREASRERLRVAVTALMDSLHLDALVYPTWSNPPRLIGDLNTPAGDNSQIFSPSTGFPAITVPMGYTRGGRLPAGMTFFGRAWSEGRLITLAYGYEQATHHRHPPASTSAR
ncbi:MAG TPA: amidase family protein [Gemmatimonadaceae bacterium]|nr:amidase family protein [Gemmatimonadaceae bacterium]